MTNAQRSALKWLMNRNADGVFAKDRVLVAAGERVPITRSTWNKLRDLGMVEEYIGRKRLRVTPLGKAQNLINIQESEASHD